MGCHAAQSRPWGYVVTAPKRCKAHNRQGNPCGQYAVPGATVCHYHGGSVPAVKRAAARRLAQAEAAELVAAQVTARGPLTLPEVYAELLTTAAQVVTWRDVLGARVAELEQFHGQDHNGDERVRADVALFERAMDRAGRVLELIGRLDLDSRMAALDERTGAALARVIRRVLDRAEMTPAAREDALARIVPDELRREAGR